MKLEPRAPEHPLGPTAHAGSSEAPRGGGFARGYEVFRQEFAHNLRRPLFWVLILLTGLFAFLLAGGEASISSGDARVGGTRAWITSEFAVTQLLILMVSLIYAFFVSVGAGMSVIRDADQNVGELLHSTRLTPAEYVWGKYFAQLASFLWVSGGAPRPHHALQPRAAARREREVDRPVRAHELPQARAAVRAADADVLGRHRVRDRRAHAPAGAGVRASGGGAHLRRVLPVGMVAGVDLELAQQLAHVRGSLRAALDQRDLAQRRQGRGLLQPARRSGSIS
jgi:hypothetical protein